MRNGTALRLIAAFLCVTPAAGRLHAQPQSFPARQGEEAARIFSTAITHPGDDMVTARVDILYRIDREFFVAFRNPDSAFSTVFQRRGEVMIELIDSTGISRARDIQRFTLTDSTAAGSPSEPAWCVGAASLTVAPGRYTVAMEVDDLESERHVLDRERMVNARAVHADTLTDSDVFFVLGAGVPSGTLIPQNLGGDVLFGASGSLVVEVPGVPAGAPQFRYTITTVSGRYGDDEGARVRDSIVTPSIVPGRLALPAAADHDTVRYQLSAADRKVTTLVIPLPLETLPLRSFRLHGRLTTGADTTGVTLRFRNVWPDMPFSLRDVDMALDMLKYITRPSQLDSLKSGSFEQRRDNLEAFWKPRDPHPETAYNEVMTQYYRRVDQASRSYGTLHDPDGARTDRGKIYILHGPPAHVERSLDPKAGFREIWTYTSPARTFVFLDESRSGTYILVSPRNTKSR